MSLRRRKSGDTPVSPAPPCRTHLYREFSSLTLLYTTKPHHKGRVLLYMADRVRFELTVRFRRTHDFQSCAFDHSAIYPNISIHKAK